MLKIETLIPMLSSAFGLKPQEMLQRANDFELFARTFGIKVVQEQKAITEALATIIQEQRSQAERLSAIESMLITALTKTEQLQGPVIPAGDCWTPIENAEEGGQNVRY